MSDYAVEIKIKNGRVLRLMRRAGIPSVAALSRKAGVSLQVIYELISLKQAPLSTITGDWRPSIHTLADALNCLPDDMFSDAQRAGYMNSNKRIVEMSQEEVDLLLDSRQDVIAPDDAVFATEQRNVMVAIIDKALTPRQALVLKARFGFDQDGEKTLDELAATLRVGRERVRQIENVAMRRLNHARNKDQFRDLL